MSITEQYVNLAIEYHNLHSLHDMLTILDFIRITTYPIDKLYINKFWASLQDDQLIYINDDLIRWMGFDAAQMHHRKMCFTDLMKKNGIRYIEYNNDQYAQFKIGKNTSLFPPVSTGKGTGTLKHILLDSDSLKLAMLNIGNGKGRHIREHYLSLEKLLFVYMRYQCEFRRLRLSDELDKLRKDRINEIRARACSMINTAPCIECIYFIRAGEAVKIGRSTDVNRRLMELQIGCPLRLTIERTIITDIGPTLESKLHGIYEDKHIHGEWYKLDMTDIINAPDE
jgi:hypothetical protein